ncbi:hypothetical protein SLA2020_279380 [Shorea laevis]
MAEKGDTTKQQQQPISSSPKDPLEESTETRQQVPHHHQLSPAPIVAPFISAPPFEAVNPKRPRYTGQWKLLPSPTTATQQKLTGQLTESSPTNPQTQQSHTAEPPPLPQTAPTHLHPTLLCLLSPPHLGRTQTSRRESKLSIKSEREIFEPGLEAKRDAVVS